MNPKPFADFDLSRLAENRRAAIFILILLGTLFFIPGIGSVPLFDWDEANFAEASREMLSSGNYGQVTINYQPFYEKPPFYFWLQTLSMRVFGVNEFSARIVDALTGIATLVVVFLIGSRVCTPLFGFLWALAFFGSFMPHLFFKSGVIDPVFNLLTFLGLSLILKALLTDMNNRRPLLFVLSGLCIGLATLVKGPVAFLIVCLTMLAYWTSVRFKPIIRLVEIAVFLFTMMAVSSVFFGLETLLHGTTFIRSFIAYQVRLFSTSDAGQGRPFYFHFFVILFGCFPASFFAILSFFKRYEPGYQRNEKLRLANQLMIILFWVVLILFSIVKTKTVLYSSLTWFPVTYLAALSLHIIITERRKLGRALSLSLVLFTLLISLAVTALPILLMHRQWITPLIPDQFAAACLEHPVHWSGFEFLLGIGYGVAVVVSLFLFENGRPAAGTVGFFGSSALCLFLFSAIYTGRIEQYCQGGPVAFYKAHANEDVYIRSLFKSYTDLFYSRVKRVANPCSRDRKWLLHGPIDKPVYFVCRVTEAKEYDTDTSLHLTKIKEEYGFTYYRREAPLEKNQKP
jgi:4-amino-4-deoxy-L-arabinose transferase-like glycosyltransferase